MAADLAESGEIDDGSALDDDFLYASEVEMLGGILVVSQSPLIDGRAATPQLNCRAAPAAMPPSAEDAADDATEASKDTHTVREVTVRRRLRFFVPSERTAARETATAGVAGASVAGHSHRGSDTADEEAPMSGGAESVDSEETELENSTVQSEAVVCVSTASDDDSRRLLGDEAALRAASRVLHAAVPCCMHDRLSVVALTACRSPCQMCGHSTNDSLLVQAAAGVPSLCADCRDGSRVFCDAPPRVLFVGLGGGSVPSFVACTTREHLQVDAVELCPAVVDVARDWFALHEGVNVTVANGAEHIAALESEGASFAAIVVDVAAGGSDVASSAAAEPAGLIAPAAEFTTDEFFEAARRLLCPGGILAMNALPSAEGAEASAAVKDLASCVARCFDVAVVLHQGSDDAGRVHGRRDSDAHQRLVVGCGTTGDKSEATCASWRERFQVDAAAPIVDVLDAAASECDGEAPMDALRDCLRAAAASVEYVITCPSE